MASITVEHDIKTEKDESLTPLRRAQSNRFESKQGFWACVGFEVIVIATFYFTYGTPKYVKYGLPCVLGATALLYRHDDQKQKREIERLLRIGHKDESDCSK